MRLLIIEDEPDLACALRRALEDAGFACDVEEEGHGALFSARSTDYDAVLLDLMLPGLDGRSILRELRAHKRTPVLVLTARDAIRDKVELLNLGADDYLTKPFALTELIARVRALVRRAANQPAPVIDIGDVRIDMSARTVIRAGSRVSLSPKEYALVELLALRRGSLVTRTMIYEHLYNEQDDTYSNVVDVFVSGIRRKLGPDFVRTRRGEGYILDG